MQKRIRETVVLVGMLLLGGCAGWHSQAGPAGGPYATHDRPIAGDVENCQAILAADEPSDWPELDPENLEILNWNVKKGSREAWEDDLMKFATGKDLVLIQEAAFDSTLTDELPAWLGSLDHWSFAPGYESRRRLTGVMTLSRSAPVAHCSLAAREPWLGTPKATGISKFRLAGTGETLLVINVHAINFTIGVRDFSAQLDQVRQVAGSHAGPVILSGDFNTWRRGRMKVLEALVDELDLAAVTFDDDHRSRVFGFHLDHIFVRGLNAVSTDTRIVRTSDHNPLSAVFAP